MDADWEVEIGGGAPVIEAFWPGFIDFRAQPELAGKIGEVAALPPLADLLRSINGADSPLWTSKCDCWEPEPGAVAIYIDMLPRAGKVFAHLFEAEAFCRDLVGRLLPLASDDCCAELVIRQAIAGELAGFGITAYMSASGSDQGQVMDLMTVAMVSFAEAFPRVPPLPRRRLNSYNRKGVGE